MNKQIIFFDIDGTISDEKTFEIPESTIKAMHLAKDNGHILIINTGRGSSTIEKQIKNLPVDGFICGCGTEIIYHNKQIVLHQLSDNLKDTIVRETFNCHLETVLEGSHAVYFPKNLRDPMVINTKSHYLKHHFNVKEYNHKSHPLFEKMALWFFLDSQIDRFIEIFKNDLSFIRRDANFYEVIPLAYSKATGIKELIDLLNIPHQNTYAIGDSANDLTMLNYVHTSIAMGNSKKDLFPLVDYITSDIHDNGIYHALKHFHII